MTADQPCRCRCHAYGPGAHVTCDVDTGSSGVPGVASCSPCDGGRQIPLDEACVLHMEDPAARYIGMLCRRHYHRVDATLRELEELFALCDDVILPGPSGETRSGTRFGSPAPGRIEIMALTDHRAVTNIPAGKLDDDLVIPDLPGTLAAHVRVLIEEHLTDDDGQPAVEWDGTVTGSIRLLRRERKWIAAQPWVDDYVTDLDSLHRALAHAVGATMWPEPVGRCPNCQTPLYNTVGVDAVTCRRCKASWSGVNLARLRLIFEQEAK